MSDLDEFMGGSGGKYEDSEWHRWETIENSDGSPKMEKQLIWDRASKAEVESYLACFKPLKGAFVKTFIFTGKKYGTEQIGFQIKDGDKLVQFATGSKNFGMQIQRHNPQPGDCVRIRKWGEGTRTKYELEIVVGTDSAIQAAEKMFKNEDPSNINQEETPF